MLDVGKRAMMKWQNTSSIRIPHGCLFYLNMCVCVFSSIEMKLCVHKYHFGRMVDMAKWHIFSFYLSFITAAVVVVLLPHCSFLFFALLT